MGYKGKVCIGSLSYVPMLRGKTGLFGDFLRHLRCLSLSFYAGFPLPPYGHIGFAGTARNASVAVGGGSENRVECGNAALTET